MWKSMNIGVRFLRTMKLLKYTFSHKRTKFLKMQVCKMGQKCNEDCFSERYSVSPKPFNKPCDYYQKKQTV